MSDGQLSKAMRERAEKESTPPSTERKYIESVIRTILGLHSNDLRKVFEEIEAENPKLVTLFTNMVAGCAIEKPSPSSTTTVEGSGKRQLKETDSQLKFISKKSPQDFERVVNALLQEGGWRIAETEMSVTDNQYDALMIRSSATSLKVTDEPVTPDSTKALTEMTESETAESAKGREE